MTDLRIRRLSATIRLPDADAERTRRLLPDAAGTPLEHALAAVGLPDGLWCVRRVDARIRLDLSRSDALLRREWADALAAAIRRELAAAPSSGREPDVIRYAGPTEALLDLVCGTATGRTERGWAWRLAGVAPRDETADAAATILAALRPHPHRVPAVLTRAVVEIGLPALHRTLGRAGWRSLADLVRAAFAIPAGSPGAAPSERTPPGRKEPANENADDPAPIRQTALARELYAGSPWADAVGRSGLRPDPEVTETWALLAALAADPALPLRSTSSDTVAALAELLYPAPRRAERHTGFRPGRESRPSGHPSASEAAPGKEHDEPTAAGTEGVPTRWAGLLFLLGTAPSAGIPDVLLDDPALASRSLPWTLQGIALDLLPVEPRDAALAALAGRDPNERPLWERHPPPTAEERAALHAHARHWAAVTARVLGADDTEEAVHRLARRDGRVEYTPGWMEIVLDLAEADTAVRRAGLDLDPDWVPWLGAVVRFRYV